MVNYRQDRPRGDSNEGQMAERVVQIRRVAKVVAGGRRLRFTAMVVIGDQQGNVGVGLGKASAVPDAVRKRVAVARKNMLKVPLRGSTIHHEILVRHSASSVLLKPAPAGTGVIAGGSVRAVMELAGVTDVVSKVRGSTNPINVVYATFEALGQLKDLEGERARRERLRAVSAGAR